MKRVFADTFYFLALLNPRDKAHARALAYTAAFQGEMVTTAWILTELGDALSDPANRMEFAPLSKTWRPTRKYESWLPMARCFKMASSSSRRGPTRNGHSPIVCPSWS